MMEVIGAVIDSTFNGNSSEHLYKITTGDFIIGFRAIQKETLW